MAHEGGSMHGWATGGGDYNGVIIFLAVCVRGYNGRCGHRAVGVCLVCT